MSWKTVNRSIRVLMRSLLFIALTLSLISCADQESEEKSASWKRWDVDITVHSDGSFDVVETHEIGFSGGEFTFGFRNIPLRWMEQITDIQVREGDTIYTENTTEGPNTFYTQTKRGELFVNWFFPPTVDASRTFTVSYTVEGGLLIYEDGDQLYWKAVGRDRGIYVWDSTVTVTLPEGAAIELVETYGVEAQPPAIAADGRSVTFTAENAILNDDEFEVRVQWPHGVVDAPAPSWQADWERQAAIDAVTGNVTLVNLIIGALSAELIIMGIFIAYRMTRYPRPKYRLETIPATLNEPPGNLKPGLAGVLLEGETGISAIMATLVDLAQRGMMQIEETTKGKFTFRLLRSQNLKPYEQAVLDAIFTAESGKTLKEVKLTDLKDKFYARTGKIYNQLGDTLVEAGLFRTNPNEGGCLYILLSVIFFGAGFASMFLIDELNTLAHTDLTTVMPCAAGGVLAAASLHIMSKLSPRLTREGAEQLARWQAFKNYLEQIQQFIDLEEATDLFEKYLPYVVAFGIEGDWIKKFAYIPMTAQPDWYISPQADQEVELKPGVSPDISLDGMAEGMFAGLTGLSAGLFTMLNSTADTFTSQPASSSSSGGSSFSGGGGFSSGGGGGGGGGGGFG